MLTWDDWGGYDDHVKTPVLEHTPDNVQLAYRPRVPLLMFGGAVKKTIDNRWCGHASIPKTAIDLLGLPPLGVARVDDAPSLIDLVDRSIPSSPPPPKFGTTLTVPPPPSPPVAPKPAPPPPAAPPSPVGGSTCRTAARSRRPTTPRFPHQRHPPTNA